MLLGRFKKVVVLVILISSISFAQKIRGFGGVDGFLNRSFDQSGFAAINVGAEYKINDFFKPEVKLGYFLAALQDRTSVDSNGLETELLVRTATAFNIGIITKINFGDEDDTVHFQILPIYNYVNVIAKGSQFTLNAAKTDLIKTAANKFVDKRHSVGFGIGVLFDLSDETFQSIAINLLYNNVDIGNALTSLNYSNRTFRTDQSLGLGIKFYFGFVRKKTK